MHYYAHTAEDDHGNALPEASGKWQPLSAHLGKGVRHLARQFWTTEMEDRNVWHVRIVGDKSRMTIDTKAGFHPIAMTNYLVA